MVFAEDFDKKREKSTKKSSFSPAKTKNRRLKLHPLFLLVGGWYACTGDLFLFLISTLVALQHECAHAFAAAKLGYRLNAVVLMPFGAVIDGDLRGISLRDEIFVAVCGPLCNAATALFFVALWWLFPSLYPFTDVAVYSSVGVALVNLLPCYPLDGGRVLRCLLTRVFYRSGKNYARAERSSKRVCAALTYLFAVSFFLAFCLLLPAAINPTLLGFSLFLLFGALGNKDKSAVYDRVEIYTPPPLRRGIELKRVAISSRSPIKESLRFLSKESYLVLEIYGEEGFLFTLPQNVLSELFLFAQTPYESFISVYTRYKKQKNLQSR